MRNTTTSSRGSAAGRSRSSLPAGPQNAKSGRAAVRANRSAAWAKGVRTSMTTDTSGPAGSVSSVSIALSISLASRLRAVLRGRGSPECRLTWSMPVTASRMRYCQLVVSARRTSGRGSGGTRAFWPTPIASEHTRLRPRKGQEQERSIFIFHGEVGERARSEIASGVAWRVRPSFPLELMGYPRGWAESLTAALGTRSFPRSPRRS